MAVKSSTLIYGVTGAGKTGFLDAVIEWLIATYGKDAIALLYTAEPNGLGSFDQKHFDNGNVKIWDVTRWPHFQQTLHNAAQGMWPSDLTDPSKPSVSLEKLPFVKNIKAVLYEGGTQFAQECLSELQELGANNAIAGAEAAPARLKSGDLKIANANQTMYGIAQSRVKRAMIDSHNLSLPVHLFWTCREIRAKFNDPGEPTEWAYGPEIAGRAATKHIAPLFGDTIHLARIKKTEAGKEVNKRILFFDEHYMPDDPDVPFIAQIRVPPRTRSKLGSELDITDNPDAVINWLTEMYGNRTNLG